MILRNANYDRSLIETAPEITRYRFKRLIDLGHLHPSGDTLFEALPSQTYTVSRGTIHE